jgi:hypothetical protein
MTTDDAGGGRPDWQTSTAVDADRDRRPPSSRAVPTALAAVSIAAFAVFAVIVVVAGLREPGYSATADGIGGLGARNAEHPDLMNAGFLALAVAIAAAGGALLAPLPGKSGKGASILLILAGVGVGSLAFVQQDCSTAQAKCAAAGLATTLSVEHTVHRALAVGMALAVVVALWMIVVSLSGSVGAETVAKMTKWVTIAATVMLLWYGSELYGDIAGAVERVMTLIVYGWPIVLAAVLSRSELTRA